MSFNNSTRKLPRPPTGAQWAAFNGMTPEEWSQLAAASRKARPTVAQRKEFAILRAAWAGRRDGAQR